MGKNLSNEEKLAQAIAQAQAIHSRSAALEAELQIILPPKVFDLVHQLARRYLQICEHDQPSRELIALLALMMRQEAFARFGHDTLETVAIGKLLVRSAPPARKGRLDALTHISRYRSPRMRLDADQEAAAKHIQTIWQAFGKFLFIAQRGMGGGGGQRSRALAPMDVMDEDIYQHYREYYVPWYNLAAKTKVKRQDEGNSSVTLAGIVFKILVEDVYPESIDAAFALIKGTALKALKAGLSAYFNPVGGIKL